MVSESASLACAEQHRPRSRSRSAAATVRSTHLFWARVRPVRTTYCVSGLTIYHMVQVDRNPFSRLFF